MDWIEWMWMWKVESGAVPDLTYVTDTGHDSQCSRQSCNFLYYNVYSSRISSPTATHRAVASIVVVCVCLLSLCR